MINRDMKPYMLQYLTTGEDDYGYPIEAWVNAGTLEVALHESYKQTANSEGVLYLNRTITAVTRFNGFTRRPNGILLDGSSLLNGSNVLIDKVTKYRIVAENTFEVVDVIKGRMTQLQLKEVV